MTVIWIVWGVGTALLMLAALGLLATIPLMRRRVPDPADHPSLYRMPCEDAFFASRDGIELGGWWIPAEAPRGTVILAAGQNGSLDKDLPQAAPLHAAGFNVLMFDWRAHGRSEGEMVTLGAQEQADLLGALDYVQQRGIARAGVLGFSMGAGVALLVAAYDPRVQALVVDGAFPHMIGLLRGWGRQRGLPGPLASGLAWVVLLAGSLRSGYQLYRANPVDLAARITAPVLFVHGERDPFVSTSEVEALASQVQGPVEVWRVPTAEHRQAFGQDPEAYNRRVVGWFEQHLAAEPPLDEP